MNEPANKIITLQALYTYSELHTNMLSIIPQYGVYKMCTVCQFSVCMEYLEFKSD